MITYNAALKRPAYQSSVYSNAYGGYGAHLANDGSRETRYSYGRVPRCSISQSETNPWWAVDLERPTEVYAVNFTNRGDCCGMNKYKFISNLSFLLKYIVGRIVAGICYKYSTGFSSL